MNPKHLAWMSEKLENGRFYLYPNGSHLTMYEDQQVSCKGSTDFIHGIDKPEFYQKQAANHVKWNKTDLHSML